MMGQPPPPPAADGRSSLAGEARMKSRCPDVVFCERSALPWLARLSANIDGSGRAPFIPADAGPDRRPVSQFRLHSHHARPAF
jgi:hypothetical protein